MQSKEQKIEEVRKGIKDTEKKMLSAEISLGDKLFFNADPALLENNKAYKEAKSLNKEIDRFTEAINSITGNQERIKGLTTKKKEYTAEIDRLEKENHELYESVGKVFYNAFKTGDINENKYQEIFAPALSKEEKIAQVRDDLNDLEKTAKDKNFIKMVMDSGKKTVLLGNLSLQQKALLKDLQKAGERICQEGLVVEEKGVPLSSAVEPFLHNKGLIESLTEQKRLLEEEVELLNQQILDLSEGKKPSQRIEELEERIESLRKDLEIQYRSLTDFALKTLDKNLLSAFSYDMEELAALTESLDNQHKDLERLLAVAEIDRLDKKITDMNLRIRTLEDNIKRQQEEIKRHKREIAKAQKEKETLEPVAFPPQPEV